jgi:hypothetical protein
VPKFQTFATMVRDTRTLRSERQFGIGTRQMIGSGKVRLDAPSRCKLGGVRNFGGAKIGMRSLPDAILI